MAHSIDDLLKAAHFPRELIRAILDPGTPSWIKFDPELGYIPTNIDIKDGAYGSQSSYRFEDAGYRLVVNCRDKPCRVNTYGDSYTQCQQVSDGETWQEYLAGHFGEPIRNYGVAGYGVNQSIRRAVRLEDTEFGRPWIVLNIFDDDHIRSLDSSRWLRSAWRMRSKTVTQTNQIHGLPWCHVRYDLQRHEFIHRPSICSSTLDLELLCEQTQFANAFRDDQIVRLFALQNNIQVYTGDLEELAEEFGIRVNLRDSDTCARDAKRLHLAYGINASVFLVGQFRRFLEDRGKKLMILLSYGDAKLSQFLNGGERFDKPFIDFLQSNQIDYVDSLEFHNKDFKYFSCDVDRYLERYFVRPAGAAVFGHYSPAGNHFFAYSIASKLVGWLSPPPPSYR